MLTTVSSAAAAACLPLINASQWLLRQLTLTFSERRRAATAQGDSHYRRHNCSSNKQATNSASSAHRCTCETIR